MVKPSDFKAVHRLIQLHCSRVNPVTTGRSKLFASSSPAFPSNGVSQLQPKSSFHSFSSNNVGLSQILSRPKLVPNSQICGLALVKPRVNMNFASAFRLFSSSGFRKVDGNFARKIVDKPINAVSSTFGRYRVALGLQVDAFWKKNNLLVFGAGGVFVCIFLWRIMFGIASTFVGLSEGMAKYGFLALSSAIVAFAGLYLRARFTINPDKVYRIAMRKLNTAADILEVMGAPLAGSDLRAYVMSGGGITLKKFKPTIRSKRCFLLFPVQGSERKGLVSVEVKKKKGQLWSCICCCRSDNNKSQSRSQHGSRGKVHSVTRIEKWEEKITEANNNGKILVVYFSAPWCVPCKKIEPAFRELASKYPSMIFVTIDVEELAEFSNEWNVEATPTVVFLKDGRQIDKLVGAETLELQKKTAAAADLILRKP